jgi:hypothetical protein
MGFYNPDDWTKLATAFTSAPVWASIVAASAVTGVVAWWVRGKVNDREIGGLKGEISLLERQLKDAVAKSAESDTATVEVERRLRILEEAIASKADTASLVALASQLQSSVGELAKTQAAVSKVVSQDININTSGLVGVGTRFAAGDLGQRR